MNNLDNLIEKRFEFLKYLYEKCKGSSALSFNMSDIGKELGMSPEETGNICIYLKEEGLIKFVAQGGFITITHAGIKKIEKFFTKSKESIEQFPKTENIIIVQQMVNSQIQQANINSNQTGDYSISSLKVLSEFIELLKSKLPHLDLSNEDNSKIRDNISKIESQISYSRPKISIIEENLVSIRNILEGILSSAIANELLKYLPALFDSLMIK